MEVLTYNIFLDDGTQDVGIVGVLDISNDVVRVADEGGNVFAIYSLNHVVKINVIRED